MIKKFIFLACSLTLCMGIVFDASARSPSNARHSGIEPPDGPRGSLVLPGNAVSRTDEGGMGYTDAYGRTLRNETPAQKDVKRLRRGAYGGQKADVDNHLPDPVTDVKKPWKF